MIDDNIINKLDIDLVKMNSRTIGYVGYNLDYKILAIIYQNRYSEICLYENVPENVFNDILNEKNKCGIYIATYIKDMYNVNIIPRRRICRTLFV